MPTIQNVTKELIDTILEDGFKPSEIKLALLIFRLTIAEGRSEWTDVISVEELAAKLNNMGMSTVSTAIKELRRIGLLETTRDGGGPNSYRLVLQNVENVTATEHRQRRRGARRDVRMS